MSSSAERAYPRVGIIRGATANPDPVIADVRRRLPAEVLDPVVLERIRTDAADAGWADGYAAGMAQADQEAAAQRAAQGQQFMDVMTALLGAVNQLRSREAATLHEVADQAATLALAIAGAVLQREVATAADPGRDAIARAIALAPTEGDVRIRLNPADLAGLGAVDDLAPGRAVELVPDPAVACGDAVLHVGATRVDAQIATALARVQEVLRA